MSAVGGWAVILTAGCLWIIGMLALGHARLYPASMGGCAALLAFLLMLLIIVYAVSQKLLPLAMQSASADRLAEDVFVTPVVIPELLALCTSPKCTETENNGALGR